MARRGDCFAVSWRRTGAHRTLAYPAQQVSESSGAAGVVQSAGDGYGEAGAGLPGLDAARAQ